MDIETTFDLLSSEVRRDIVAALDETSTIARSELTAKLADGDAGPAARRRLRIALHHRHLPRLADAGVVEYDGETVTATARLEALVRSLSRADRDASAVPS